MTGFGIYLIIVYIIGIAANLYSAGQGGLTSSPGTLLFGAAWASLNFLGILLIGTGFGI